MDVCPNCQRKLISHSSAKCNWCGAVINDPQYQAEAAANRDAYFAEQAAHDANSLANSVMAFDPNFGGLGFASRPRGPFGLFGRRQNLPVIPSTPTPLYPTAPPPAASVQPPTGATAVPLTETATAQGYVAPPPGNACSRTQVRRYGGVPQPQPRFGEDLSRAELPSAKPYLKDQQPVYPARWTAQTSSEPAPADDQASDPATGRFKHLEL